jgi:hypothetical protein
MNYCDLDYCSDYCSDNDNCDDYDNNYYPKSLIDLLFAIRENDTLSIKLIFKHFKDLVVNSTVDILMFAIKHCCNEIEFLIKNGCTISIKHIEESLYSNPECLELLLKNCRLQKFRRHKTKCEHTLLEIASLKDDYDSARLLIEYDVVDVNLYRMECILHIGNIFERVELLKLLNSKGYKDKFEIIKKLIQYSNYQENNIFIDHDYKLYSEILDNNPEILKKHRRCYCTIIDYAIQNANNSYRHSGIIDFTLINFLLRKGYFINDDLLLRLSKNRNNKFGDRIPIYHKAYIVVFNHWLKSQAEKMYYINKLMKSKGLIIGKDIFREALNFFGQ